MCAALVLRKELKEDHWDFERRRVNNNREMDDWCARIKVLNVPNEGASEDVCLNAAFGHWLAHSHAGFSHASILPYQMYRDSPLGNSLSRSGCATRSLTKTIAAPHSVPRSNHPTVFVGPKCFPPADHLF